MMNLQIQMNHRNYWRILMRFFVRFCSFFSFIWFGNFVMMRNSTENFEVMRHSIENWNCDNETKKKCFDASKKRNALKKIEIIENLAVNPCAKFFFEISAAPCEIGHFYVCFSISRLIFRQKSTNQFPMLIRNSNE